MASMEALSLGGPRWASDPSPPQITRFPRTWMKSEDNLRHYASGWTESYYGPSLDKAAFERNKRSHWSWASSEPPPHSRWCKPKRLWPMQIKVNSPLLMRCCSSDRRILYQKRIGRVIRGIRGLNRVKSFP